MSKITWTEKVPMLSINPDAATTQDIGRLASELMECRQVLLGYEEFEAKLIIEPKALLIEVMSDEMYDGMRSLQEKRNKVLGRRYPK